MIPTLFTAVLIACSGPAPERCVDVPLGVYSTPTCFTIVMPLAADWLSRNRQFRFGRLECRQGSASA